MVMKWQIKNRNRSKQLKKKKTGAGAEKLPGKYLHMHTTIEYAEVIAIYS